MDNLVTIWSITWVEAIQCDGFFVLQLDIRWNFEALDTLLSPLKLKGPIEGFVGFLDEHWHDDNNDDFFGKLFIVAWGAHPMYGYNL